MKLIQLNIWQGRLLRQVLEFIEKEKPDILCMQEVFSSQDSLNIPDRMFDSLQQIQKITGHQYSFFSPTFSGSYAGIEADYGTAIVSKYPITKEQTIYTDGINKEDGSVDIYALNNHVLQACEIVIDDSHFNLVNHHGHWEPNQFGSSVSVEKMQIVKDNLEKLSGPLIFTGDLNVVFESDAMRVFDNYLKDLTAEYNVTSTLSSLGKVSNIACDHILINEGINVANFKVAEDLVSDHKALILDFSF